MEWKRVPRGDEKQYRAFGDEEQCTYTITLDAVQSEGVNADDIKEAVVKALGDGFAMGLVPVSWTVKEVKEAK